ncbi:hypothetical protein F5Y03DRAFT_409387 [Xylaria venustula]|nr:hypothetical protein F5Y03DRAFT_409387 [Xylaria venustula]
MVTAAHIVRHDVGEPAAVHLFGPTDNPEGHIWSIRNGLSLLSHHKQMWDDARIAIIPTQDINDLMVIVLDKTSVCKNPIPITWFPWVGLFTEGPSKEKNKEEAAEEDEEKDEVFTSIVQYAYLGTRPGVEVVEEPEEEF